MSPAGTPVDVDLSTPLETARSGQVRLAAPGLPRRPYATGQQELCLACVAAAVPQPRRGVSRDGFGSPALCLPCWRAGRERQRRQERAELSRLVWDRVGEIAAAEAAEAAAAVCAACGDAEASPACWLCGYAWLTQMREQFEADQIEAEAASAADVDAELERLTEVSQAEARVADLIGWVQRLRRILAAWKNPARVGRWGRAVELIADLLARLEAARVTARGRPSLTPLFGAVLAVDSDVRSGRRALPGRLRTAWLLDCSHRAVYTAQQRVVAVEWAVRTRRGGRNSLERRIETGRWCDRAEFDLVQLHTSTVPAATRAAHVPAALALLGEVLRRALVVLDREEDALDELRARASGWTDWAERIERLRLRHAMARVRDAVTGPGVPAMDPANMCHTHTVTRGEYLSSCSYWGLPFSPSIMIHSAVCNARPCGRREGGASRSSTRARFGDLEGAGHRPPPLKRPRKHQGARPNSRRRTPPAWTDWAYDLAKALVRVWPWLAGEPRPRVAATLGARLGPDWTATGLARWVTESRTRPVLAAPDMPLAYLAAVLDEALSGERPPPAPARRYDAHRAQVAVDAALAAASGHQDLRAEFDARDAAAAASTGRGRAAARAALAAIVGRRHPAPSPPVECEWPEVAQPGSGGVRHPAISP